MNDGAHAPVSVPQVSADAPLRPFEWPYWDLGESIRPCPACRPWQVEIFRRPEDGSLWIREWHAAGCPVWSQLGVVA